MDQEPLDTVTDNILLRLKHLSSKHVALFSASVAERFVGLYEIFARRHGLENGLVIRRALDAVWQFLWSVGSTDDLTKHLAKVQDATPSSEDFDSLESILAQNVCIAVDATIRSCLGMQDVEPIAGEFGIEALRAAVSHKETGFVDVGSGPDSRDFLGTLVRHPVIAKEIELQQSNLSALESNLNVSNELVTKFKRSAENNRIDMADLLDA